MINPDTAPGGGVAAANTAAADCRPRFPLGAAVLGLIALVALAFIYRRYSLTFPINSDLANDMLEAQSVVHGNVLLHNWVLTTVSFYMSDVVFYAMGMAVRGFDPILLHEVPVTVFMVTLVLAVWLSSWRYRGQAAVAAAATTFVLMGLPVPMAALTWLLGPFRAGTMVYVLLAFAAIDGRDLKQARPPLWRLAVFTLALAAADFSDTLTLYAVVVPVLIMCGLRLRSTVATRSTEFAIMIAAVLSVILAKAMLHVVALVGGFTLNPISSAANISFVTFANLPQNISWTIEGLLAFFGADFFGQKLSLGAMICLIELIPLAILLHGVIATLVRLWRGDTNFDRLSGILALGIFIILVSYVTSTLPVGLATVRYFIPFVFMGAILAGRRVGASFPKQTMVYTALAIAGLVGAGQMARQLRTPPAPQPGRELADWLQAHQLENGYGGYWCSADTTTFSHGKVRVRPITEDRGKITPMPWGVNRDWYIAPANFAVIDEAQDAPAIGRTLPASFGPYFHRYIVGPYTVFVYSHDLTPLLKPMPPIK